MALYRLAALLMALQLFRSATAATYVVGDTTGWTIPAGGAADYVNWAAPYNFSVGDILVFNFAAGVHDVARVTRDAFNSCSTNNPVSLTTLSPANITLSSAGPDYYICTFGQHCSLGQKLTINVSATATAPPAPAPAPTPTPTPTPTTPTPAMPPPRSTPVPTPTPAPTRPSPTSPSTAPISPPMSSPTPTPNSAPAPTPMSPSSSSPSPSEGPSSSNGANSPSSPTTGEATPPEPANFANKGTATSLFMVFVSSIVCYGLVM